MKENQNPEVETVLTEESTIRAPVYKSNHGNINFNTVPAVLTKESFSVSTDEEST